MVKDYYFLEEDLEPSLAEALGFLDVLDLEVLSLEVLSFSLAFFVCFAMIVKFKFVKIYTNNCVL